jgi:hypothetical protein
MQAGAMHKLIRVGGFVQLDGWGRPPLVLMGPALTGNRFRFAGFADPANLNGKEKTGLLREEWNFALVSQKDKLWTCEGTLRLPGLPRSCLTGLLPPRVSCRIVHTNQPRAEWTGGHVRLQFDHCPA